MDIEEVAATPTADIANEVPADDNPEEANASQTEEQSEEQTDALQDSKGSRSFTKEERAAIIELAKEVGATKVAREIGVNARLIYYWLHQEKKNRLCSLNNHLNNQWLRLRRGHIQSNQQSRHRLLSEGLVGRKKSRRKKSF